MDQRDGFVLTRSWRDASDGIQLTYWLVTDDGPVRVRYRRQRAVMFVERDVHAESDDRRQLALTTFQSAPVDALYFASYRQLQGERDRLRRSGARVLESDIKPSERFLMERFVTGGCKVRGELRPRAGYVDMDAPQMVITDYRPRLKCMSIDIETEGLGGRLLSIAAVDEGGEWVFMVGEGPAAPSIRYYRDERTLLSAFFRHVSERDPDALIGWNVVEFDLVYLQRRCEALSLPSPWAAAPNGPGCSSRKAPPKFRSHASPDASHWTGLAC